MFRCLLTPLVVIALTLPLAAQDSDAARRFPSRLCIEVCSYLVTLSWVDRKRCLRLRRAGQSPAAARKALPHIFRVKRFGEGVEMSCRRLERSS